MPQIQAPLRRGCSTARWGTVPSSVSSVESGVTGEPDGGSTRVASMAPAATGTATGAVAFTA